MGREERDGGGFQVIDHEVTKTREELTAEIAWHRAKIDAALKELLYHDNRVCGEFEMNGHCSCIPKAMSILKGVK